MSDYRFVFAVGGIPLLSFGLLKAAFPFCKASMVGNGKFSPPILKSSASVDSGITFDSDSNGEFYEAEDVSRPSTAFASAEEDEGESKITPPILYIYDESSSQVPALRLNCILHHATTSDCTGVPMLKIF